MIYSYSRFSNIKQEKGHSLERQAKNAQKVINQLQDEYGLELDAELDMTDKGLSGFKGDHKKKGAFGVFLRSVEEGIVKPGSILLIESLDRMSREQPYKAQSTLNDLIDADITIVSTVDEKVYNKETVAQDPLGTLILAVLEMVRAHKESLRKQEMSVDSILKQVNAHLNGQVADVSGSIPFWTSRKSAPAKVKGGFELNEHESTIRLIVDMYFKQKMGLRPISRELLNRNIKSPKGRNVWGVSTLSSILANPALCGRKVFKLRFLQDGKQVEHDYRLDSYFPKIMDENDFDAMQAIKKRKAGSGKGDKSSRGGLVYLLTDYGKKAVCAKCGRGIGSQPQKQKNHIRRRLHCFTHKETENCCRSIIQDQIEDAFLITVSRYIDYSLINEDLNQNEIILVSERLQQIEVEIDNIQELFIYQNDPKKRSNLGNRIRDLEAEKNNLDKQRKDIYHINLSQEELNKFVSTVNEARDYRNNEARTYVKDILIKSIKRLAVHMERKPLSDYGYPNLFDNELVNVIDVEFYSDVSISIFIGFESQEALFTKIPNDLVDPPFGGLNEQELQYWNDNGGGDLDNLVSILGDNVEEVGELSSKNQAWLNCDVAEVMVNAMLTMNKSKSQ